MFHGCDRKMHFNGYMTVEASFVFPLLILLYFLVVMTGFLLTSRCLTSQNDSILALRGARFTDGCEGYGEVIYGREEVFDVGAYILPRLQKIGQTYPVYTQKSGTYGNTGELSVVTTEGGGRIGANHCVKKIRILDPIGNLSKREVDR